MEYGAIDLHKKESQIRILTESGEFVDRRVATTRERLTAVFWGRPRMRILLEAATESEWVARHLEMVEEQRQGALGYGAAAQDEDTAIKADLGHDENQKRQHWETSRKRQRQKNSVANVSGSGAIECFSQSR